MKLLIHTDGGARGNPGPAGVGITVTDQDSGRCVREAGYFLGVATNNVAEYRGLLRGLDLALEMGADQVEVRSDSELMVRQINGQYRVKSADLRPLYEAARERLKRIARWSVVHVPRSQNAEADRLANLAMDRRADVAGPEPSTAAEEPTAPTIPCWTARLEGRAGKCLAGVGSGGEYTFGPTTPEGFCVHAAAACLEEGPLRWTGNRWEGKARCAACGLTLRMSRLA